MGMKERYIGDTESREQREKRERMAKRGDHFGGGYGGDAGG